MVNVTPTGGQVSFDEMFYGISVQESGGNYSAVNGNSGALGKYQIMPANVPAWSKKYFGTAWTSKQFLQDHTKQETLAKAVLQDYYNKWGPRGAAAAWYSGNPALQNNYGPQHGGPSIGSYVDQVLMHGTGYAANTAASRSTTRPFTGTPTTIDKTVQPSNVPTPPDTAQMGPVSAQGTLAATAAGMDAANVDFYSAPAASEVVPSGVAPSTGTTASTSRQLAIAAAAKNLGVPYSWGGGNGTGPSKGTSGTVGFDCSGFVEAALNAAGISSKHFSFDQLAMGPKVPMSQLQPGDLVGMLGGDHIGLYAGNNQIYVADHAGTNTRLRTISAGDGAFGVSLASLYK